MGSHAGAEVSKEGGCVCGKSRGERDGDRETLPGCRSSATHDWPEYVCVYVCVSTVGIGYGCHDCQRY